MNSMSPSTLYLFFFLLVAKCQGDCLPTTPTIAESLKEELDDGLLIARLTFTQAEVVKEEEEIAPTEELVIVGDNGEPEDVFPLSVCQGDCDDDDECIGDLQCFNRDDLEEVAGCIGDGESGRDYCSPPDSEEEEPTTKMISTNPCSFEVYQGGEYIFTDQVQAFTIQEIFHDGSSSNLTVGDTIPLLYSTDTGYREFFLASPLNNGEDGFLGVVKLVSSCYINEEYKYPYPIQEAASIQPYEMNECNFNLNVPWSSVTDEEQVLLQAIKEENSDVEVVCSPLASVFQGQALQSKFMNTTMSSDGDMTTWNDSDIYINGEGDEVVGTQSGNCTLQLDVSGTDGEWECRIELIFPTGGITLTGPSSFDTSSKLPVVSGFGCYDYYDKSVYNGTDKSDFILQSPVGRGFKYELNGPGSSTAKDDPTEATERSSGSSMRRALCVCMIQIVISVNFGRVKDIFHV